MRPDQFPSDRAGRVVYVQEQGGHYAFVPRPLPPDLHWTPGLATLLSEAAHALGRLSAAGEDLPNPHLLMLPFMRREAVLSSRIEGTQTTLAELFAHEVGGESPEGKAADVEEVHNYVRALERGLEQCREAPPDLALLQELHAILLHDVRGRHAAPGRFRERAVFVGVPGMTIQEATFVPPPAPQMQEALRALATFLREPSELPPLARIAFAHYQFEAIHPFLDGNGRIGRLLVSLLLCAWGLLSRPLLHLSAFFEEYRREYYDFLLAVSQRGAWEEWLTFFLAGVRLQAEEAAHRAKSLSDLRLEYHRRLQEQKAPARLYRVVDLLFARPTLTVTFLARELEVDFPAAARYIGRLASLGLLRETTGKARGRTYLAEEILRAIEDPLPSEPRASRASGQ